MSIKKTLVHLIFLVGFLFGGAASAQTQVVIFGDSLSDNGNLFADTGFPPFPYGLGQFPGRFSDGQVWVEYYAADLGVPLVDSAWGGSLTGPSVHTGLRNTNLLQFPTCACPDVLLQVLTYVGAVQLGFIAPDPGAVYVIFAGANDFFDLLGFSQNMPTQAQSLATINAAITNMTASDAAPPPTAPAGAVALLSAIGAVNVVIVNLPDLGLTPSAVAGGPATQAALTQLTDTYNSFLASALNSLDAALPNVNIIQLDVAQFLRDAVANPAAFGFTNVTQPCFDGLAVCMNPAEFLFWDGVHPTTVAHRLLATEFGTIIDASIPPPLPPIIPVTVVDGGGGATALWLLLLLPFFVVRRRW